MNIKQKVVLGVMVGVLSCIVLFVRESRSAGWGSTYMALSWEKIIVCSIPVILIGGYLIFILGSKKEDK